MKTQLDVVGLAWQIIGMAEENRALREEVEHLREYKRKYYDMVDRSLQHSQEMSGQVLTLLLNKGEFPEDRS